MTRAFKAPPPRPQHSCSSHRPPIPVLMEHMGFTSRPGPALKQQALQQNGGVPSSLARLTQSLVPPQKDFTVREELQQQDVERWLGFITFLCEVFGTMRSSTGEPFRVLVCPIYTCLREVRDPRRLPPGQPEHQRAFSDQRSSQMHRESHTGVPLTNSSVLWSRET